MASASVENNLIILFIYLMISGLKTFGQLIELNAL